MPQETVQKSRSISFPISGGEVLLGIGCSLYLATLGHILVSIFG